MVVAEAAVLLLLGLFMGILATVFDVLVTGAASFMSHFALWVLLNALVAVHVESRVRATWWAIPFNLGFIESYFITTAATYEGFAKSLVVPLAAVALVSPFLTFALWTAKSQKNAYGRTLSLCIVAGTLAASYFINGSLGIYPFVVCALLAFVLLVMPVKRLKITRARRPEAQAAADSDEATPAPSAAMATQAAAAPKRRRLLRRKSTPTADESLPQESAEQPAQNTSGARDAAPSATADAKRRAPRPTRRKGRGQTQTTSTARSRQRKADREREDREREERVRATARRRAQTQESDAYAANERPATLGNARAARRSTRSQ